MPFKKNFKTLQNWIHFSLILKWKSSFFLIKYVQVLSYAFNERGKDLNQFWRQSLGFKMNFIEHEQTSLACDWFVL